MSHPDPGELEAFRSAVLEATRGAGQVLVVTGEAGIGKTHRRGQDERPGTAGKVFGAMGSAEWGELVVGSAEDVVGKDPGGELVGGQRGQEAGHRHGVHLQEGGA
jgi:hypothetical protein